MERADKDDLWARYLAIQLTPEQKAELRKRDEAELERARGEGVYEKFRALRGKVQFTVSLEELREDDD